MSRSELNISRWLEAHSDRNAGLTTFFKNAILADVAGDGDHRLVVTDIKLDQDERSRLKVYKGTLLTADLVLPDIPSSIISFYHDRLEPRTPVIAVACASELLIYKNNKPFFKFTVPPSPPDPLEANVWKKLFDDPNADFTKAIEDLNSLNFNDLCARSQEFLSTPQNRLEDLVKKYKNVEPNKTTQIICMTCIKKSSQDKYALGCPILATEDGTLYILDPQTFIILHQANISAVRTVPFVICATGLYDVDYRIFLATRDNQVCILKRNWLEGKCLFQLTNNIVDMVVIPGENSIIVATDDKTVYCYTKKGQKLWFTTTINQISCLCIVSLRHLGAHLIAVGLKGGPIHLYQGRNPVDYTSAPDTPSCLVFGQLGQEEHVLVIITMEGTLNLKILKRTAGFNLHGQDGGTFPVAQAKPLPLPKRSKLFLEQSQRERQNPIDMHQNFQQDLVRLRVTTARALVQNIGDQSGVGNEKEQVKLSAQVLGLGPKFTLILSLENMSTEKPLAGLLVVFQVKSTIYVLSTYMIMVPLVPPGLSYKMMTKVTEVIEQPSSGEPNTSLNQSGQLIRVFVLRKDQTQPVLAATINMPPTEMAY